MRTFLSFLIIYLLFVIQVGILPVGPDLILLSLIVFALYETSLIATILGTFAGLCLDLTNPAGFGVHILLFSGIGYGVVKLRDLFYQGRWNVTSFTVLALGLKLALETLTGLFEFHLLPFLITNGLTLILSPFAEPLIRRLLKIKEKKLGVTNRANAVHL